MVKQVKIERFKSISSATLDLSKINVLVGTMLGKAVSFKLFNLQHLLLKPLRPIRKM